MLQDELAGSGGGLLELPESVGIAAAGVLEYSFHHREARMQRAVDRSVLIALAVKAAVRQLLAEQEVHLG